MQEPDDAAWTVNATHLDGFFCDTLFAVRTEIRFCDPATGLYIPGAVATLPTPDLPLIRPEYATTLELLERKDEASRHYQRVVEAFVGQGQPEQLKGGPPCFWVTPAIIAGGEVVTSFVWYDDVPEAVALLQALIDAPHASEDVVWDDLDQGWRARILRSGNLTYLAEWNWEDENAVISGYAFDTMALARQAADAVQRLNNMHHQLVDALGFDYWSHRHT